MASLHRSFSLRKLYADIQSLKQLVADLQQHDELEPESQSTRDDRDSHSLPKPEPESLSARDGEMSHEAGEWEKADNFENPMNWSTGKKIAHFMPPALLCLSVTAGASMITPGTFEIMARFHVSQTAALLSLSMFVLGLALGPTLAAPISESMGRAVVYKATFPIYMLFIIGAGSTKTFGGLLVCRFLAAAFGAPCLAVAAGTVADLYRPYEMATPGAIVVMTPFLGPCLGPIIGGIATFDKDWRWTQWCTVFLSLAAYITVLPTKETHQKVLLKRRCKRLALPSPEAPLPPKEALKLLFTIVIFRPVKMLVREPIVLLLSLYNAFTFSVLFAFFEAFPYTFLGVYDFNVWQYGLTFFSVGLGVLIGVSLAILIDRLVYQKHLEVDEKGHCKIKAPEERLYVGMFGALCVPVGLIWFAMTAKPSVHWIVPVLAGVPFALGNVAIFISAALYMIDVYGPISGASAMAANGLMRYALAAAFPLFTVQMYDRLGIEWATGLLGLISVFMLPIPLVFYRCGPAIRKQSRYSTYTLPQSTAS